MATILTFYVLVERGLKNRHEKVQENCIDLVGRIADRGAEFVPSREWMRICFELLKMFEAHKKGIRRATVNTFGYIAKAIGCVYSDISLCSRMISTRNPCRLFLGFLPPSRRNSIRISCRLL